MAGLVPFNGKNSNLPAGLTDFYNVFDNFFGDSWLSGRSYLGNTFKVDVEEKEKNYVIEAELPGINKEQVDLALNDGRLTISVTTREEKNEEKKNYVHKERRVSSMSRSIYLTDAKGEGIKAKLTDGVLTVTVPKADQPDTRKRIEIE